MLKHNHQFFVCNLIERYRTGHIILPIAGFAIGTP